jgi:hypothetical protein
VHVHFCCAELSAEAHRTISRNSRNMPQHPQRRKMTN